MTAATRGSQRWLQIAVNRHPLVIDAAIRSTGVARDEKIEWRSPLESESFDEYRDDEFLRRLDVSLDEHSLGRFWPRRGPQWDGLARCGSQVLLVEAKANIQELETACGAKSKRSIKMIKQAFRETQEFLRIHADKDWSSPYYQYANRLAHLYLLRELNGLDAYLLFIYFLDDWTKKRISREEWRIAIRDVKNSLGLPLESGWLERHVKDVFIDTADLSDINWPLARPQLLKGPDQS